MWYQKNKIFGRMLISFVSLLLVAIILCSALIYKLTSDHMIVWLMRKNYRPLKPLIERLRVFASQNEKDEYTMMDTAISSLETSNRILLQRENQRPEGCRHLPRTRRGHPLYPGTKE